MATALALVISLAADAQHVLPNGPATRQTPIPTAPIPACGTAGTAAVAPPQVGLNVVAAYAILTLPPNPNASHYIISRLMTSLPNQTAYVVSGTGFKGTEFWDAFPDVRYQYAYTVTMLAIQRCYVSTTVRVSPPYKLSNPEDLYGEMRIAETPAVLTWHESLGAIAYRIDGPGLPNTGLMVAGETFVPGQRPNPVGTPESGFATPTYRLSANVPSPGVNPADGVRFWVTAMYPGNYADYTTRSAAAFARVQPTITSIPSVLLPGATLVIKGNYLYDPGDWNESSTTVLFGLPKTGWDPQHPGVSKGQITLKSPTEIDVTVTAGLPSGYVGILTYAGNTGGGAHVSGKAVSSSIFTVGTPLPPPPPPPPQVRVPSVYQYSYAYASSTLTAAGLVARSANGATAGTVQSQSPLGGAMAPKGGAVTLVMTSGTAAAGVSKIIVGNGTSDGHGLFIWLYDGSTQQWSLDSSTALAYGAQTTLSLQTGHVYTAEGMDATRCDSSDHDSNSCQRGYVSGIIGNANGGPTGVTFQ